MRVWTRRLAATLLGVMVLAARPAGAAEAKLPQTFEVELPDAYERIGTLRGTLNTAGSDTLANKMIYWAERFDKIYPDVRIKLGRLGSVTGAKALMEGTADLAAMSRPFTSDETDAFVRRQGHPPTGIVVALDAVTVFVHEENPLRGLSLPQVKALFAATGEAKTWGDVGLAGPWASRPVVLFGRDENSGTRFFFQAEALDGEAYKAAVKPKPGNRAVISSVARTPGAAGYASISFSRPDARALPIARGEESPFVEASFDAVRRGTFPLARKLYFYVNKVPGEPLPPLIREFCLFVLSREGQVMVKHAGFGPLSREEAQKQAASLIE